VRFEERRPARTARGRLDRKLGAFGEAGALGAMLPVVMTKWSSIR
jgi:hypothetical protein